MISDNNIQIELEAIRIITQTGNTKLIEQLKPEWFEYKQCQIALSIWKDRYDLVNYVHFCSHVNDNNVSLSKLDIQELWEYPFEGSGFDECVRVIRRKFNQRRINEKLDEMKRFVFNKTPEEVEMELISYFKNNDLMDRVAKRKITDADADDNDEDIINIGEKRPYFEDIVPMKKTVITLMGNSGHLKSGQALDISLRFLQNNKGRKVVFFSKEMERKEIRARIYSLCLGIGYKYILKKKDKDGNKIELEHLTERMLNEFPDVVENLVVKSPQEFSTNADIAKVLNDEEPDIFVLDFLQWYAQMQAGNSAREQNVNVMETMAFLKNISQITNTLCINLSQIRKKTDARVTVFPRLDDIEWSGLTKQISHSVGCLFWPWRHLNTCEKNYYLISWEKVRNGEPFTESAHLDPETSRFTYPHPPPSGVNKKQIEVKREGYRKM